MNVRHMKKLLSICSWLMVPMSLLVASVSAVYALAPAGAEIGNQASATYRDANGDEQTVTSESVVTTIVQVGGVDLVTDETRYVADGEEVFLPLTLTNAGNGSDVFDLSLVSSTGDFSCVSGSVQFFEDNGGVPGAVLAGGQTPAVPAAGDLQLFVSCEVPLGAGDDQQVVLNVQAVSGFDSTQTVDVDKTIIVTDSAFNVIKRIDPQSGPADVTVTVSLEYQNLGSTTEDLTITDDLDASFVYQGNAIWLIDGNQVALTDAPGDRQGSAGLFIDYQADAVGAPEVTVVLLDVPPQTSGVIRFDVQVSADVPPGAIENVVDWEDEQGQGGTSAPARYTVEREYSHVLTDPLSSVPVVVESDDDNQANDIVTQSNVSQGGVVRFANVLTNTGNAVDDYRIDIDASLSGYPATTTYTLTAADGAPLFNDTVFALQPGEQFVVVLNVNLPSGFTDTSGAPFDVIKTAVSLATGETDDVIDRLGDITEAAVDLTNNQPLDASGVCTAPCGQGAGPEATPVTSETVGLGESAIFVLYVNNSNGDSAQDYVLTAAGSADLSAPLPMGWQVRFLEDADGIDAGADGLPDNDQTQQTGVVSGVSAGGFALVFAEVTVPASGENSAVVAAGNYPIYFGVDSPLLGVSDVKYDEVVVEQRRSFALAAPEAVSVRPGQCVEVLHQLTNTGNVVEGDGTSSQFSFAVNDSNATAGVFVLPSQAYWDAVNPSVFDDPATPPGPDDVRVDNDPAFDFAGAGLAPGETQEFWVRVCADPAAPDGALNTATLTVSLDDGLYGASTAPAPLSVVNTVTVVDSILLSEKFQARDAECDGVAAADYVKSQVQAAPGECVCYRITATNDDSVDTASSVKIFDVTPPDTTYAACNATGCAVGVTANPGAGNAGSVQADFGALVLQPSESAEMQFCVQIDDIN